MTNDNLFDKFDDLSDLEQFANKENELENIESVRCTKKQRITIYSLFGQLDCDKSDYGIESVSTLTVSQANSLIDELLTEKEQQDEMEAEEDYEYFQDMMFESMEDTNDTEF